MYIGRFAPTPSGPLHLGSLVAALGSFLDAKKNNGLWLLRIDDIDKPREASGAADQIFQQLEFHSLYWDQAPIFQSQREELYHSHFIDLIDSNSTFNCSCSRARLKSIGGNYDGHCRTRALSAENNSVRLKVDATQTWGDLCLGNQVWSPEAMGGDFVIKRRDAFFSYQFATAIDDMEQDISHVVRGLDLLDSTARQRAIHQQIGYRSQLAYGHLPLAMDIEEQKLSKQNGAKPLDKKSAARNTILALKILGLQPPNDMQMNSISVILSWAIAHWKLPQGYSAWR